MSDGEVVQLYVYDLSRGLAKVFSPMLLNKTIEGVWHTSVVVGGTEYFYGHGINSAAPGTTPCGTPVEIIELGRTQLDLETRGALLADLSARYTPTAYSLFDNNCNNFSDEFAQLLVGRGIPDHITALPGEVLATPFGQMLRPALQGLERQLGSLGQQTLGQQLVAALTGAQEGVCAGDEPTSPRTLERDVDSAIARTMVADLRRQEAAGARSDRAGVEAGVEAELAHILAAGEAVGEEEAAAQALQHEAQRLAGKQALQRGSLQGAL